MKVIADRDRCIGAGQCVAAAPEVFDQDEQDGLVVLLDAAPDAELHEAVREAATLCPASAILAREDR
ncbi:ferredoxin [Nonomuraea sp. LPB2021202275-12-8]|uniref:ferredoxin n=1 Tax=Nonomuraea sp. LPB2021202275-12-8 TaxID=3120159 RepID=UPI00300CBA69